MLAVDEEII